MKQVRPTRFTTPEEVMAVGCKEVAGGFEAILGSPRHRLGNRRTASPPTHGENLLIFLRFAQPLRLFNFILPSFATTGVETPGDD